MLLNCRLKLTLQIILSYDEPVLKHNNSLLLMVYNVAVNKLSIVSGSNPSMSDTDCYVDILLLRISALAPILEFNSVGLTLVFILTSQIQNLRDTCY